MVGQEKLSWLRQRCAGRDPSTVILWNHIMCMFCSKKKTKANVKVRTNGLTVHIGTV